MANYSKKKTRTKSVTSSWLVSLVRYSSLVSRNNKSKNEYPIFLVSQLPEDKLNIYLKC